MLEERAGAILGRLPGHNAKTLPGATTPQAGNPLTRSSMNPSTRTSTSWSRAVLALLTLGIGAAAVLWWWVERGRSVALPEVESARLQCVSYAPFRRPGETPFDPAFRVSPQRIEQDLRILRERAGCVRTYAVHQGLEAVPAVARRLGMRVKLGAWIGRDAGANAAELERAVALAREYRDVVELLIVGNEVLLRQELAPAELARLLERARREAPVPVTYADVWEYWLRHDFLRRHVDVVTVHILPYWEDHPVAIEAAVDHVFSIAAKVRAHFSGTPVLVGETGWPARGRQREGAVPGHLNQARFAREFVARVEREPLRYNFIEGFDQPWKRQLEGAMGGYWGLFDRDGVPRFAWSGPVAEDRAWWSGPLAAALAAIVGFAAGRRARFRAAARGAMALGWALTASTLVAGCGYLIAWQRGLLEGAIGVAVAAVSVVCALLATRALALRIDAEGVRALSDPVASRPQAGGAAVPSLAQALCGRVQEERALALSRAIVLFGAASIALALVFEGRYRGFPWALFAAPALTLLALRVVDRRPVAHAPQERMLALVIAACACAIVWIEGGSNTQAIGFASVLVCLSASMWPACGLRT